MKKLNVREYLIEKYSAYGMMVHTIEDPMNFEEKYSLYFVVNNVNWKLEYIAKTYGVLNPYDTLEHIISLVESKIKASYAAETKVVKPESYVPIVCPCCGGLVNAIDLDKGYVKCDYCDVVLRAN